MILPSILPQIFGRRAATKATNQPGQGVSFLSLQRNGIVRWLGFIFVVSLFPTEKAEQKGLSISSIPRFPV